MMSVSRLVPSVKSEAVSRFFPFDDLFCVFGDMDGGAERLDLAAQEPAGGIVELHRHQPRRELDHVGLQAEVVQRLRRFEAEQPAADHRADARRALRAR